MRLGLYGGSFDPIHRGHVEPVRSAARALGLDRVVYLPTGRPPHKLDARLAPALRRFAMVELALVDEPELEVSTFELDRAEPAYTVDTLEHALARHPDATLYLLLGVDSFVALPSWRRFEDLPRLAHLVVLRRGGETVPERAAWPDAVRDAAEAGRVHVIDNPPLAASSTEIRRRLRAGTGVPAGWMAPAVLSYIEKYGLYTAASTHADALAGASAGSEESPPT